MTAAGLPGRLFKNDNERNLTDNPYLKPIS
jgi:hypothetical protein